ncbi:MULTISPECIES: ATP-NAD kinase family protein [unclassified Pseudomonas]|uniref:ATP-NAD kinase family protein n=1 Tax=unclassified Pseudomonas TaxID=196821 RepID=UPI001314BD2A|nr:MULTISPECIES: ATP-NAD kinase family protein [unclassified Pseudomonas]
MTFKVGLLINPYAGLGGTAGLKGSDGAAIVEMALARGAQPQAQARCIRALKRIVGSNVEVYTVADALGERACRAAGVNARVVATPPTVSTARDTVEACHALLAEGIDLLLFGGGDGTARDVMAASGSAPALLLGIPCGVKMYSGVFARTPEHAGDLVRQCAEGPVAIHEAEVLDIDEQATRSDRISTRLYGYARVPAHSRHMQSAKAGSTNPDRAVADAAQLFASQMLADHLYFLGPGRTVQALAGQLDGDGTLLGVDAYLGHKLVCRDASERELLALAAQHPVHLVVSLTGGQGCLFGRGNQQISAAVLARVDPANLHVLASAAKIAQLPDGQLFVDTGDPEIDVRYSGFTRVHTAPGRSVMLRVTH